MLHSFSYLCCYTNCFKGKQNLTVTICVKNKLNFLQIKIKIYVCDSFMTITNR